MEVLTMEAKQELLVRLYRERYERLGMTIDFLTLTDILNSLGYRTEEGTEYSAQNPRGVARVISCVVARLRREGRDDEASGVAHTFVNKDGNYSYE